MFEHVFTFCKKCSSKSCLIIPKFQEKQPHDWKGNPASQLPVSRVERQPKESADKILVERQPCKSADSPPPCRKETLWVSWQPPEWKGDPVLVQEQQDVWQED